MLLSYFGHLQVQYPRYMQDNISPVSAWVPAGTALMKEPGGFKFTVRVQPPVLLSSPRMTGLPSS